jgi:hypothetical protein
LVRGGLTVRLSRMKTSCPKEMSRKEIRQGIKNVLHDFRMCVAYNPIRWNGEDALLQRKQVTT